MEKLAALQATLEKCDTPDEDDKVSVVSGALSKVV